MGKSPRAPENLLLFEKQEEKRSTDVAPGLIGIDPFGPWWDELKQLRGAWKSEEDAPHCLCIFDGDVVEFPGQNVWNDLDGRKFYIGPVKKFMTNEAYYILSPVGEGREDDYIDGYTHLYFFRRSLDERDDPLDNLSFNLFKMK